MADIGILNLWLRRKRQEEVEIIKPITKNMNKYFLSDIGISNLLLRKKRQEEVEIAKTLKIGTKISCLILEIGIPTWKKLRQNNETDEGQFVLRLGRRRKKSGQRFSSCMSKKGEFTPMVYIKDVCLCPNSGD